MIDDPSSSEDKGVLGSLPHSRPGRRSEKRDPGRPGAAAGAAARKAEASDSAAARSRPKGDTAKRPRTASKPAAERAAPPPPDTAAGGPIEGAVHAAAKVAGAGARVAGGLAHEVFRRLPRP